MKIRSKQKREYDDDGLLPLVNIIFLLLIFFMIAGVIEKRFLKDDIEPPIVKLTKFENKDITKIFIDKNNIITLEDKITSIENMTKDIDTKKTDNTLPEELIPILQQILEQVEQGSDAPSLATEYEHLLLQRYIHYSAHYNAIETMVAGLPAKLQGFHPNAPAPSGERLVYPQTEGD